MIEASLIYSIKGILSVYGPRFSGDVQVFTDTRKVQRGSVFLALSGKRYNAIDFISDAIENGAIICIYTEDESRRDLTQKLINANKSISFVSVADALVFLQLLAKEHVAKLFQQGSLKQLIGITGSNGKTTTKEMLFHFLSVASSSVAKTEGNLNNHIGVPLTLLSLDKKNDCAVVEMGTSAPGEIFNLCEIAMPNAGIITNIGQAHLEFFGSQENIFFEKRTLFDCVMANTQNKGFFLTNMQDPYLQKLPIQKNHIQIANQSEQCSKYAYSLRDNVVQVRIDGRDFNLTNDHLTGVHNYTNLAAAFMLASAIFPDHIEAMQEASDSFHPTANRSQWMTKWGKEIFLDAYNANPDSMKASVEGFVRTVISRQIPLNECVFVLGDMNELGGNASHLHEEIGRFLYEKGIIDPIFIGRYSMHYQTGFKRQAYSFGSVSDIVKIWKKIITKRQYVFIKGSRSLQLETLLDIN